MILISVDLPAPFSPTSARTSPRPSEKSTPLSAAVPAKALLTARISKKGRGSVGFIQKLRRVPGVEEPVLEENPGGNRLPGQVALQRVEGQRAEAGVGLDARAQLALEDGLQRQPLPVDGHHHDVL